MVDALPPPGATEVQPDSGWDGPVELLSTELFVPELHRRIAQAQRVVALQLLTFDGDAAGQAVAASLMAAAERGVTVRVVIDCFALRFISDRPVDEPDLADEVRATLAMYDALEAAGVELCFTNENGPFHLFALARNHKKIYVIDDVAYLGGINISDHNLSWHDFMVRLPSRAIAATLLADVANTMAGRRTVIDQRFPLPPAVGENEGGELVLVTNDAVRDRFDRLLAEAGERVMIGSPYALDRRLASGLEACRAPSRAISIATHNNFRFLEAITPYLATRVARRGIQLLAMDRFSHAKFAVIDDTLIMGSANFARHSLTCNQEVCLIIRHRDLVARFEAAMSGGLVPVTKTGPRWKRAFGWFATIVMELYLRSYAVILVPRVKLVASRRVRERLAARIGPRRR